MNIREARTKPTSPDRSLLLLHNSYNQPSKKSINNTQSQMPQYLAGVNQREERKAFNMISSMGQGKMELMHHHQHSVIPNAMSSLSSNQ